MNWFDSERNIHEHVLRAEKLAEQYPHVAHLLMGHLLENNDEDEKGATAPYGHVLASLGGVLVTLGNHLQERWSADLPAHTVNG